MKQIYTTVFAMLVSLTGFAQKEDKVLIDEGFSGSSFAVSYDSEDWGVSSLNPNGTGGTYLQSSVSDQSKTMAFNSNFFQTEERNRIEVKWVERNTNDAAANRTLAYRTFDGTKYSSYRTLKPSSENVTSTWQLNTAILHLNQIAGKQIELLWIVNTPSGVQYSIDDISVLGSYADEPTAGAPLPVELASFDGYMQKSSTKLTWTTALEINNDKFVIERSSDGKNFSSIGQVKGNGNSAIKRNYSFVDNAPSSGINYYRLIQVDLDGTINHSAVIVIEAVTRNAGINIYPTVASSSVKVSLQNTSGRATINVTDITGRTIATINNINEREIELPVQKFKSGVYFVRVIDGQNQQVQRFIKE